MQIALLKHAAERNLAAPVLTPQVASPRLRFKRALTAKPLSRNSSTVGSRRYAGALYPGSSSLHRHITDLQLCHEVIHL